MRKIPSADKKLVSSSLESGMEAVKSMIETMNAARQDKGIKLRWPVDELLIRPAKGKEKEAKRVCKDFGEVIKGMGNVKRIDVVSKGLPKEKAKEFPLGKLALGDVLHDEALIRELIRKVQITRKKEKLDVKDKISICFDTDGKTTAMLKAHNTALMTGTGAASMDFGDIKGPGVVRLDLKNKKVKFHFKRTK